MYGEISIERSKVLKPKPVAGDRLGFGKWFTDHMFLMDYTEGKGWHDPRIVPYGAFTLDPSAMVFHYGQATFEGLKAFRTADGSVRLFRPEQNARRMNHSNDRIGMPQLDEAFFVQVLRRLVTLDADWVPTGSGASLYVRPFVIATEPALGVRASSRYLFAIILSPVGSYYGDQAMKPINIYVEDEYVRAVRGGTGNAKTPGNYASSIKAQALAKQKGCDQVLWLDGVDRKYIEEVGSMNVFFKIGGTVVTPELGGSILAGIMRDSVIRLLQTWGVPIEERRLSITELSEAATDGRLEEVFGTGTAAVISPVGGLCWSGGSVEVGGGKVGQLSRKLYDAITGIQTGRLADEFGWTVGC
jgi:branched-chain amino acid aminotransferase